MSDSPYLNHFIQPDTIIPDLSNPQSLNRYSYVQNNPTRFNDPTGHKEVEGCGDSGRDKCHASALEIAINAQKVKESKYAADRRRCLSGKKIYCIDQSDADFRSTSFSFGAGPWFLTFSFDVVATDDEMGVFFSYGTGPGLRAPYTRKFKDLVDFDGTFMSPQAGVTLWSGKLYGESLADSVDNYSGLALQTGGSRGPLSAEVFSSVNEETGMIDNKVQGEALGLGLSAQQAEVHVNYSNAINIKPLSFIGTWYCQLLGSCRPRP